MAQVQGYSTKGKHDVQGLATISGSFGHSEYTRRDAILHGRIVLN